jgi:hypothetical protein
VIARVVQDARPVLWHSAGTENCSLRPAVIDLCGFGAPISITCSIGSAPPRGATCPESSERRYLCDLPWQPTCEQWLTPQGLSEAD